LGLSGGLIGPPGGLPAYEGRLEGTQVLLGCSDTDPHIPKERVKESARIFTEMGASVTLRLYPGLGHTIHPDEIDLSREILISAAGQPTI
jgi:phospholipase/carboxylesterase